MPPGDERWMTVAEVAEHLQLSRAKIYELAQSGVLPCVKVAGRWRFSRDEVDDWMRTQRSTPPRQDSGTGSREPQGGT